MGRPPAAAVDTATPERILTAAAAAFGRSGLEGARLADIARAAGITRPSLLYHFRTKDALYAAVVQAAFARLKDALVAAIDRPAPFGEAMDAAACAYQQVLGEQPDLAGIVLRELLAGDGPGARVLLDEIVPLVDLMERFVLESGGAAVARGLPARAAILQVATAALVRAASGPLRRPLWGADDVDHTRALVRRLFDPDGGGD